MRVERKVHIPADAALVLIGQRMPPAAYGVTSGPPYVDYSHVRILSLELLQQLLLQREDLSSEHETLDRFRGF